MPEIVRLAEALDDVGRARIGDLARHVVEDLGREPPRPHEVGVRATERALRQAAELVEIDRPRVERAALLEQAAVARIREEAVDPATHRTGVRVHAELEDLVGPPGIALTRASAASARRHRSTEGSAITSSTPEDAVSAPTVGAEPGAAA